MSEKGAILLVFCVLVLLFVPATGWGLLGTMIIGSALFWALFT